MDAQHYAFYGDEPGQMSQEYHNNLICKWYRLHSGTRVFTPWGGEMAQKFFEESRAFLGGEPQKTVGLEYPAYYLLDDKMFYPVGGLWPQRTLTFDDLQKGDHLLHLDSLRYFCGFPELRLRKVVSIQKKRVGVQVFDNLRHYVGKMVWTTKPFVNTLLIPGEKVVEVLEAFDDWLHISPCWGSFTCFWFFKAVAVIQEAIHTNKAAVANWITETEDLMF